MTSKRQAHRLAMSGSGLAVFAGPQRLPHQRCRSYPHAGSRHERERLDGKPDLMSGIGDRAVTENEFGVEQLSGLLRHPLQCHRVADPPDPLPELQIRLAEFQCADFDDAEQAGRKSRSLRRY